MDNPIEHTLIEFHFIKAHFYSQFYSSLSPFYTNIKTPKPTNAPSWTSHDIVAFECHPPPTPWSSYCLLPSSNH